MFENIIEDERIEHLCGERTPGLAKFLASAKYHAFDRYVGAVGEGQDVITRFVNAVLTLIRYPKAFAEQDITDFGERLLQVRDILTPYPESTAESYAAAEKIVALIKDFIDEAQESAKDASSPSGEPGGEKGDSDGDSGSDSDSGEGSPDDSGTESGEPFRDLCVTELLDEMRRFLK